MADRKAVFNGVKLMIEKQQGRCYLVTLWLYTCRNWGRSALLALFGTDCTPVEHPEGTQEKCDPLS